jgi:hypothetical protein
MLTRDITDSRGFRYRQSAPVTGDVGGIYYIYLESAPFTYSGHTIRVKHNLRLLSPLNYRVAISVSDNGGPFVNYGNPWAETITAFVGSRSSRGHEVYGVHGVHEVLRFPEGARCVQL